ncbi:MAG TPA: hypothetical protein VJ608_10560 [Albitalea sp.]|nr:hypothetical protein [Albitalea sp.]
MNEPVLVSFCSFAKQHVESGDIDPTYPVLKRVYEAERLDREQALWRTLLYVAFYHLGSSQAAARAYPDPMARSFQGGPSLKTGVERRGFRGNDLVWGHLQAVVDRARASGGLWAWVDSAVRQGGKVGWRALRDAFQEFPHAGPWSSYKLADLLKNVHDLPITADDIGVGGGSATAGPIPGMVRVTGANWKTCATDVGLQQELHDECVWRGVPFNGLDQLETSLCDFNSACKGRYYVGHDIDDQMEKIDGLGPVWWEARAASFAPSYLGEVGGWFGVRKQLRDGLRVQ